MGFLFSNNYIEKAINNVFSGVLSEIDSSLMLFGPIYAYSITPSFLKKQKASIFQYVKDNIAELLIQVNDQLGWLFREKRVVHEKEQVITFADFVVKECLFDEDFFSPKGGAKVISKIKGIILKPIRGITKTAFAALQAKAFRAATIEYFEKICEGIDAAKAQEMSQKKYQETYINALCGMS